MLELTPSSFPPTSLAPPPPVHHMPVPPQSRSDLFCMQQVLVVGIILVLPHGENSRKP